MSDDSSPLFDAGLLSRLRSAGRIGAAATRLTTRRLLGRSGDKNTQIGELLAAELDRMKGVAMKLGQVLSYFDGILPVEAAAALRSLQLGTAQLSAEEVARLLELELGALPSQLFDAFDLVPVASASIGQVHRARLDGSPVAVKIQYPGIAKRLEADVRHLKRVGGLATLGSLTDGTEIARDMGEQLLLECDYRAEAATQTAFREVFADMATVRIPAVIQTRCSNRVLTTTWAEGRRFYEFARINSRRDKEFAARAMLQFAMRSFFQLGIANADPHPGNYLFQDGEAVTFLDFGCVRHFNEDYVNGERTIAHCVIDDRRAQFEGLLASGRVADPSQFDFDLHWQMMCLQYAPYREPAFRFSTDYLTKIMTLSGPSNHNLRRLKVSPDWVWHQRLVWGLHAVLVQMEAEGDFRSLLRDVLAGPALPIRLRRPGHCGHPKPDLKALAAADRPSRNIQHNVPGIITCANC